MQRSFRRRRSRHRAFFAADTIIGIAVVAVLLATLSASMLRQQRAMDRLAESRQRVRLAEQTLTALQTSTSLPKPPENVTVTVTPLDSPAAGAGCTWVRVSVTRGARTQVLVGLAPQRSLEKR